MGENHCKWNNWQRINQQNIKAIHVTQYQRNKIRNQTMGWSPKQTFLQRRHCWWWWCSVAKLCLTIYNPMDFRMPGFPLPHHLPEFAKVHALWMSDAIQPAYPLSPSSPSLCHFFPASRSFPVSQPLHRVAQVLLEKFKSKLQWGVTSHQSKCPSSKILQTIKAREDVEKREPFALLVGCKLIQPLWKFLQKSRYFLKCFFNVLSNSIPITNIWDICYYCPHFTDEETKVPGS